MRRRRFEEQARYERELVEKSNRDRQVKDQSSGVRSSNPGALSQLESPAIGAIFAALLVAISAAVVYISYYSRASASDPSKPLHRQWYEVQFRTKYPWWFAVSGYVWTICIVLGIFFRVDNERILRRETQRISEAQEKARCKILTTGTQFCCPVGQKPREEIKQVRGVGRVLVPQCS